MNWTPQHSPRTDGTRWCRLCDLERRRDKDRLYRERYGSPGETRRRYDALAHSVGVALRSLDAGNAELATAVLKGALAGAKGGVSMAMGDYICCGRCNCKLIYDVSRAGREALEQKWGAPDEPTYTVSLLCPDCLAAKDELLNTLERDHLAALAAKDAEIKRLTALATTAEARTTTRSASDEVGRKKNDRRCGECNKPIESGQPVGLYYGAHCHLNCVARARDAE